MTGVKTTEAQWQRQVQSLARTLGWVDWHQLHSMGTRAGLPDLELLHPRRCLHLRAELKTNGGTLTPAQVVTMDLLVRCHGLNVHSLHCYVWRPADLDDVVGVLRGDLSHVAGPTEWTACRDDEIGRLGPKQRDRVAELAAEYGLAS